MSNKTKIVLGANTMSFTREPFANNVADIMTYDGVNVVSGVFNQKPVTAKEGEWTYPYLTMTVLQIEMNDGYRQNIELQDVSNQPTWSTGLKTGLQQAIADINAVL